MLPFPALALLGNLAVAQPFPSDPFDSPDGWKVITADGVTLHVAADTSPRGPCLRLDYEFVTGAGFCIIQRDCPTALPDNYEFALQVRGEGPPNNLEFKLLDESGESVWWVNRRAFEWPHEWTRLSNKKRRFEFAWGPSGGAPLQAVSKIEFAIASNSGGKGSVWLDDLTFRELPTARDGTGAITATSSADTDSSHSASSAIDQRPETAWRCDASGREQWLSIAPAGGAEFGGVVVDWDRDGSALEARLEVSDDGAAWSPLAAPRQVWSPRSVFITPDAEAKFVRLVVRADNQSSTVGVREVSLRPTEFGAMPNAAISALAKESTRGLYPRHFLDQQCYWTVIGADSDDVEALVSEDGAIEVGKRGFTLEPFVIVEGQTLTWADAQHSQRLEQGGLPLPTVVRRHAEVDVEVSPFVAGEAGESTLFAIYRVRNTAADPLRGTFALAIRPFQVNPAWQRLNFEGGVSPIRSISLLEDRGRTGVSVNDTARVFALSSGAKVTTTTFDGGDIVQRLTAPQAALTTSIDPGGLASGALLFPLDLAPGASREFVFSCPLHAGVTVLGATPLASAWAAAQRKQVVDAWQARVSTVALTVPASDQWIPDTFRSQLAYILTNRDGPAIQPGSRSYERSWARDGSMTSAALLECGHPQEVRAWIDWFGARIFDSGKVPCVVDRRGPDPVPEHDSHGQYIWAVANYYRHIGDTEFLREHWPRVQRVVAYIQSLRAERMTPEYSDVNSPRRAFYGLVPESISHEGYSAKPMHSYWDDFFILLGLKEAAYLAGAANDNRLAQEYTSLVQDFRACLYDSIARTQKIKGINYIPGCVELGDFDSTSTTIALFPCDELAHVPAEALRNTFDRYWDFFRSRRAPEAAWDAYTPYEIRHVGAFIRLGQPQRAYELLSWFHTHQRPQGWNHWAEVVWKDPLTPRFIGDMPHTWVGSDYLNSVRSIFVYEQGDGLVAFAGVPREWIASGEKVAASGFVTPYGPFDGSMQRIGDEVRVRIAGLLKPPPGGIIVPPPPGCLGEAAAVRTLPAEVTFKVAR